MPMISNLDRFTQAYISCMLWTDEEGLKADLGRTPSSLDIDEAALAGIALSCVEFQDENKELLAQAYNVLDYTEEQAGHDFWLTRNGHGAGFWDRGIGAVGDALSKAAKAAGERWTYVGDDKRIHVSH